MIAAIRADPEDRETCYELQEYLIKKITYVERQIRNAKKDVRFINAMFSDDHTISKDTSRMLKYRLDYLAHKIRLYQAVLHIYKDVGDAVAYTYINRWDLKPTSFKEGPGYISGKRGARLERATFRQTRSRLRPGTVMIVNDITNCLRYGDLTVAGDGIILFMLEMKSRKTNKLNKRERVQQEKLNRLLVYPDTDRATGLYDGFDGEVRRLDVHADMVTYEHVINSMIREADQNGISFKEVEEGLFYSVVISIGDELNELVNIIHARERHMVLSSINDFRFRNVGHYPFTLIFDRPNDIFRFYNGELVVVVAVDFLALKRKIEQAGYSFTLGEDHLTTITDERTDAKLHLGPHLASRMFCEFVSLDWYVEHTLHLMGKLRNTEEWSVVQPSDGIRSASNHRASPGQR